MSPAREDPHLGCPIQDELDWLLRAGVDIMAVASPVPMKVAIGHVGPDGLLEPNCFGKRWLAFEEPGSDDTVFWHPRTQVLARWSGRAFALGQDVVDNPGTYSFDCALNIFDDPLGWLRARRDGIVMLDWSRAFDRLRDAPRIAIAESLLPLYRRHMRPARVPELFVVPSKRRAA